MSPTAEFIEHPDCACQLLSIDGNVLMKTFNYDTSGCPVHGPNRTPEPGVDETRADASDEWQTDLDNYGVEL